MFKGNAPKEGTAQNTEHPVLVFSHGAIQKLLSYPHDQMTSVLFELLRNPSMTMIQIQDVLRAYETAHYVQNVQDRISAHEHERVTNIIQRLENLEYQMAQLIAPRLGEMFCRFMREEVAKRGYIYRYATYSEGRRLMRDSEAYEKFNAAEYDDEKFLDLLTKVPRTFIIYGGGDPHVEAQVQG